MTEVKTNHGRLISRIFGTHHGLAGAVVSSVLLTHALPYANAQAGVGPPPPDPFRFNPKFSSSIGVILAVLVSVFFFLGFFSLYIRRCSGRQILGGSAGNGAALGGHGLQSRRAARGLDAEVIETFPTFEYSTVKGMKIGKGALECAVCLNEFEDHETLRLLPKCNHVFHPECIDAWLTTHTTCPVCRANLVPKPDELAVSIPIRDSDQLLEAHDSQTQGLITAVDYSNRVLGGPNNIPPGETTYQNRPPRSRSIRARITGIFPRSHSTGHSLVQRGEKLERFTLRLPEEVRNQIMTSSLNRTKSCVAFARVRSSRSGYRGRSGWRDWDRNHFNYERFDRNAKLERWAFSAAPPFISRAGSARSPRTAAGDESIANPNRLFRSMSVKTPFYRSFVPLEEVGERSSDRLRSDNQV